MNFNEDCKVIIESMDEAEASAFVKFLDSEIIRHQWDIAQAIQLKCDVIERFKLEMKC